MKLEYDNCKKNWLNGFSQAVKKCPMFSHDDE